jgi:SAM-dependent methyltransferase
MTLGSDLRGRTSADAAFQLALSGVKQHAHIFEAIIKIGTHELTRTGGRSSFKSKYILQMVEKFAASDVVTVSMFELYDKAGECLERKGFPDEELIASLRNGSFGLHSDRPLLWLWRFSARQKKIALDDSSKTCNSVDVSWNDYFADTAKGLVVDIGCGLGVSLLNLSAASSQPKHVGVMESTDLANINMKWDEFNYVGVDLNSKLINYAQGVISRRDEACQKRVEFVCCPALELLSYLKSYPGKIELLTINFPSPFRLHTVNGLNLNGNSQLPQSYKDGFMITDEMAIQIAHILHKSMGVLVFQTKCEDVAVYTKNLLLGTGSIECVPCIVPVSDVNERYYDNGGSAPKRVQEWLKCNLDTERAEGECWSSIPFMPLFGRPETEVSCEFQNTIVHRCLFRSIH